MSVVTPACCHTHLAKSAHHASFWFAMLKCASRPQPSALGDWAPTSVLYGSQSTSRKLVAAGVSPTPTWLSAMLAIDRPMAFPASPGTAEAVGAAAGPNAKSRARVARRRYRICRDHSRRGGPGPLSPDLIG